MDEILDRVLGFLPGRGTFWTAIGFLIFMLVCQRIMDWVVKKIQLPWMEEKNQQQRKTLEKSSRKK